MASDPVAAHGGGVDANGCHHDRKHGGHHCHRGNAARSPAANFAPTPTPRQRLSDDRDDFWAALRACVRSGEKATPAYRPCLGLGVAA